MANTTDAATVTVEVSPETIDDVAGRLAAADVDPSPRAARDRVLDVVEIDVELLDENGRPVTEAVARRLGESRCGGS